VNRVLPSFSHYFTFANLVIKDAIGVRPATSSPADHLAAAESWLKLAHDRQEHGADDGVSYGYSVRGGWRPSYRETSGYICTTFFELARLRSDQDNLDRAVRIARWLLSVQNSDGSFANPRYGPDGIVFDTGQVLFGLLQANETTQDQAFQVAAERAATWLVNVADENQLWTRSEHLQTAHVYNSRTAWALLRANRMGFCLERERVARANLDWAVREQQPSGHFDNCAFVKGQDPFTHTIAYATRGLLESGLLLQDDQYIDAAKRCADAVLLHLRSDGFLPGQMSIGGQAAANYCCVTGNCQFAISWAKLYDLTGDRRYQNAAIRALDYVMSTQDIHTPNLNIRGAIRGSMPVWGRYAPLSFPNWPTKFFIDAMLIREGWSK